MQCLFCNYNENKIIFQNGTCYAISDNSPVSRGHLLIIPKAHKKTVFDLSSTELQDTFVLVKQCQKFLIQKYHPDGFNVGFNSGKAAGQSIMHCHCHLIPRYSGDVPNPLGGVRGVIPDKSFY